MTNGMFGTEMESRFPRNGFAPTPSELAIPMTPVMGSMPTLDNFVSMNGTFDQEGDSPFLSMSSGQNSSMDYEMPNMFDLVSPPSYLPDMNDHLVMTGKGLAQTPNHIPILTKDGSTQAKSSMQAENESQQMSYQGQQGHESNQILLRGLQEPDSVLASQQTWPFFQCNPVEKPLVAPPKTASIYLEGLAQTLRCPDTWNAWLAQAKSEDHDLSYDLQNNISTVPFVPWTREKLLAITQGFLHKALDIHKSEINGTREDSPGGSPDARGGGFLMLPPPEVIQAFLRSYVIRYEPYYSCIPSAKLNPNELMQLSNSKASSLLVLLMVASGAISTPTVEARYLASGLTEACRISLFDVIEKDIFQAREPNNLRSALLFTTLAAWSGDKWHMDVGIPFADLY